MSGRRAEGMASKLRIQTLFPSVISEIGYLQAPKIAKVEYLQAPKIAKVEYLSAADDIGGVTRQSNELRFSGPQVRPHLIALN